MSSELARLSATLGQRFRVERELGRGGMGTVYLARDMQLDRLVALKVLPPDFAVVPELRARFLRETRMAAGFSHPNIVPVFAVEEHDDLLAFAMGFVEGESLASRVAREGPMLQKDVVRLVQDVAYALAYAHGRGVVHRDIKPDNIMIERATGRALVMDFGIARAITPVQEQAGLTRVGEVVGTPEFMSPEQATGDTVDGRADLYSLGLVAWYALAGRSAMEGESTQRVLVRQLTEPVPSLAQERGDVSAALSAVVDKCCEKEPTARFQSAEALVEALDATQLAVPEVPVAVRLLVLDLTAVLARAIAAVVLLSYGIYRLVNFRNGSIVAYGLIAAALMWVRFFSTVQELRRLRRQGFALEEFQRLLCVVQAERDEVRAQRRLDTTLVKRRRVRVVAATVVLVSQVATIVSIVAGQLKDGDVTLEKRSTTLVFFASLLGSALAATVLASSPFRRPAVEQLFHTVWLGHLGRGLLRRMGGWSAGDAPPIIRATPTLFPRAAATVTASASNNSSVSQLALDVRALESRVRRLEDSR